MEVSTEIIKIKSLLDDGLITKDEFKILKAEIISKMENASKNNKKTSNSKKDINKKNEDKEIKTKNKIIKINDSSNIDTKQKKNKTDLDNKFQKFDKEENEKKINKEQNINNPEEKDNYKLKRSLFLFGIIVVSIILFIIDLDVSLILSLGGVAIAVIWWLFSIGKRNLFFFYAPYILFTFFYIYFNFNFFYLPDSAMPDKESATILFWIYFIVVVFAFIFEYFFVQPKCSNCGRRIGMVKISDSNWSSFDYIGTKNYSIRSKSGEKIGEYEGPVTKTRFDFIAHYQCAYCNKKTSRGESRVY